MRYKTAFSVLAAFGLFTAVSSASAQGLFSYPGCADLQPSHFKFTSLVNIQNGVGLYEPVKLDFDMDENGNVNFFLVQVRGPGNSADIKYYDALTQEVSIVLTIPFSGGNDYLGGIALDPGFKENGWAYIFSTIGEFSDITRYTFNGTTFDPASKTIIFHTDDEANDISHTGGAIEFDDYGDMWFSIGDDMIGEDGPGNTASYRGKILRIRPLPVEDGKNNPGEGSTYTVPTGNFGEFWSAKWAAQGETALSQDYLNTDLVYPEIFSIGSRNAYNMTIDPVRRWVTFGDCGPDIGGTITDEHNVIVDPSNEGWPWFAGDQVSAFGYDYAGRNFYNLDPAKPIVNSHPKNTGVSILPPPKASTHPEVQACAMTGPIYIFNPNLRSDIKMPPHFHRIWFVTDYNHSFVDAVVLDETGIVAVDEERITNTLWSGVKGGINKPLEFKMGPDGAMYFVNYAAGKSPINSGVIRIEYIGPECDVGPDFVVEKAGCTTVGDPAYDPEATHHNPYACGVGISAPGAPPRSGASFKISSGILNILDAGRHTVDISDLNGERRHTIRGEAGVQASYNLKDIGKSLGLVKSIYIITVTCQKGTSSEKTVLF